jgi:hypothetical protein
MVVVTLMGGLGNQMFQYAVGKALALAHSTRLTLDLSQLEAKNASPNNVQRSYDLDIFKLECDIISKNELQTLTKRPKQLVRMRALSEWIWSRLNHRKNEYTLVKEKSLRFDPSVFSKGSNLLLEGYFQSEQYFIDIHNIIRKEFQFAPPKSSRASAMASAIRSSESVFLNVRRGDFAHNPRSNAFHGLLPVGYYQNAIEFLLKRLDNPQFFVFSDDIEWCKINLNIPGITTFVDHTHKGHKFSEYLWLMTLCRHAIIANSTFAWWGAWLGSNASQMVVAPRDWFRDKAANANNDVVPQRWIRL